jgi:flagellar motor switch protein FliM
MDAVAAEDRTLSQREIDALLNGLTAGAPHEKRRKDDTLKRYDFRSPARFSKEQMRTLKMIFEDFARQISSLLSVLLRCDVKARFVYLEQSTGREVIGMLDTERASVVNVLRLAPLPGRALLIMGVELVCILVERVLGGRSTTPVDKAREITNIELALMEAVMRYVNRGLETAWSKVVEIKPVLESSTVDLEMVQGALGDEVIFAAVIEIHVESATGMLTFLMPLSLLHPIAPALRPHLIVTHEQEDANREQDHTLVVQRLQRMPVPVSVTLGSARLSFRDLLQLQPGDVIPLDRGVDEDLAVNVNDRQKFWCRPGLKGRRLAVSVTAVLHDE